MEHGRIYNHLTQYDCYSQTYNSTEAGMVDGPNASAPEHDTNEYCGYDFQDYGDSDDENRAGELNRCDEEGKESHPVIPYQETSTILCS